MNSDFEFLNDYNEQITEEDIEYIKKFIINIIEGKGNDCIVMLSGNDGCGKSRLTKQIIEYIGNNNVYIALPNHYSEIKPLIILDAWIDMLNKNNLKYLKNLCLYKQSIIMTKHITQNIPQEIENHIKIIDM